MAEAAGSIPDLERMLKEFYEIRDIGPDGRPSKKKLESIGLPELSAKLHK